MPSVPEVHAMLRAMLLADAARLVVAIVAIAIGLASILVQIVRWKTPDRVRLWFGLVATLYGYRALLVTDAAHLFASSSAIDFQIALVTFTIGIPAILFGWGLVSKPHNRFTKSLLAVNAVMALLFLAVFRHPAAVDALFLLNNIVVITFTVSMLVYLFFVASAESVTELKLLRKVMLIWGLFVIYNNLRGILPIHADSDYEFVGFAIFLSSLAYLVARRSLQTEEALASIRSELEIARRIQTSILPESMPRLDGLSVAARYVPMSEVAGDFYDFLPVDDLRIGVLIADVSGHGIGAALVASMVKVAIAAQADHADDPAKVMAGLNSVLAGKLQGQFVTAAYLYFDLFNRTASYAAAGHPPLLHYKASAGAVEEVVENGLILGILPFAQYESRSLAINSGDRFLLYTDGVVEAARQGEEFGSERLQGVLAKSAKADEACDNVIREVSAWTRAVAGDDITLVAVNIA